MTPFERAELRAWVDAKRRDRLIAEQRIEAELRELWADRDSRTFGRRRHAERVVLR